METNSNIPKFGEEFKQNPFSTPDGYFDRLPAQIQGKLNTTPKKVSTWSLLKPQLGFVVGFVALVLMARGMFTLVDSSLNKGKHIVTIPSTNGKDSANNNMATLASSSDDGVEDAVIAYLVDRNVSDIDIVQAIK